MLKPTLVLAASILGLHLFAQEVQTEIEYHKTEEGLESISIGYTVPAYADSVGHLAFEGQQIAPYTRSQSMAIKDGKTSYSSGFKYRIVPSSNGQFELESPLFMVDGKEFKAAAIQLEVKDLVVKDPPSLNDLETLEIKELLSKSRLRLNLIGEQAVIEEKIDGEWQILRVISISELNEIISKNVDQQ